MNSHFDKDKYRSCWKKSTLKQEDILNALHLKGFDYSINGIKSWTRKSSNSRPELDTQLALADIFDCTILDFYTDSEEKRRKIAIEEIRKNPNYYLKQLGINAELFTDTNLMNKAIDLLRQIKDI